jgi:hypothetical protein
MRVPPFWLWSLVAAVSTGCSVLASSEAHGENAAVIGGIAVFTGLGAFRVLANELTKRSTPLPPFDGENVFQLRPRP